MQIQFYFIKKGAQAPEVNIPLPARVQMHSGFSPAKITMKTTMKIAIEVIIAVLILVCCTIGCSINANAATYEYSDTEEAHVHEMSEWAVSIAPTCEKEGYELRHCVTCNSYFELREVERLGHQFEAVVTDPTCEQKGYTTYTCTVCGLVHTGNTLPALGHQFDEVVAAYPTCNQEGHTTYVCVCCGLEHSGRTLPILEHSWTEWEVRSETTCTKYGCEERHCEGCGQCQVRTIAPTGHRYNCVTVKEPTCEQEGKRIYVCTKCNATHHEETIPAKGHDYGAWKVAKNTNFMQRTCSHCGKIQTKYAQKHQISIPKPLPIVDRREMMQFGKTVQLVAARLY